MGSGGGDVSERSAPPAVVATYLVALHPLDPHYYESVALLLGPDHVSHVNKTQISPVATAGERNLL